MAADGDCRLPEAASRAAAHDGAPAPWSATPMRIASISRRSPGVGSRPRWSRTIASVNVEPRISDEDFVIRGLQICGRTASTMAVRHGSIEGLDVTSGSVPQSVVLR